MAESEDLKLDSLTIEPKVDTEVDPSPPPKDERLEEDHGPTVTEQTDGDPTLLKVSATGDAAQPQKVDVPSNDVKVNDTEGNGKVSVESEGGNDGKRSMKSSKISVEKEPKAKGSRGAPKAKGSKGETKGLLSKGDACIPPKSGGTNDCNDSTSTAHDNDTSNTEIAQDETTERTDHSDSTGRVLMEIPVTVHPLQCRWVLWFLKADRSREWEDCLAQVASFDSVEDFWALYNHIELASSLSWGCDYYLFREGIKPMWEDEKNVRGGRWLIMVDKHRRTTLLDRYWLELLMAAVGEQFGDHNDLICGAVVNVRQKGDKVSLWTREAMKDDANLGIGHIVKEKLAIPDSDVLRYEVHRDSSVRTGSVVKPRLLIPPK